MKKFIIVSMSLFLALLLNGKAILAQGNLTPLVINQPMQMNFLPKCTQGTEVTISQGDKPNNSLKLHSPSGKFIMHATKKGELKLCIFCHEKINIEKKLKVKITDSQYGILSGPNGAKLVREIKGNKITLIEGEAFLIRME